jgi:hypothetical protein
MRILAIAAILLLSSSVVPAGAQQAAGNAQNSNRPQTVPVQPERSPQQPAQAREQEMKQGEDVKIGKDWRAQERDHDTVGHGNTGQATDQDNKTVGQDWRLRERR